MNLSTSSKPVRHSDAVAVGTGTVTPTNGVNTAGYEGCMFMVLLGDITDGTPSVKVQQSDDDGASDAYSDLAGSSVAVSAVTDDNKILIVEITRPAKPWLKAIVTRGGTTGCVIDGIVAVLHSPHASPTALDSTVEAREHHDQPAEGTA